MYVLTGNNRKSSLEGPVLWSARAILHRLPDAKGNVNLVGCSCLRTPPAEGNPHIVYVTEAVATPVPALCWFAGWHMFQTA